MEETGKELETSGSVASYNITDPSGRSVLMKLGKKNARFMGVIYVSKYISVL